MLEINLEALCEVDEDAGHLATGSSPEHDRSHLSKLAVDACRVEPQLRARKRAEELAAATNTSLVEVVDGKVVHVRPPSPVASSAER